MSSFASWACLLCTIWITQLATYVCVITERLPGVSASSAVAVGIPLTLWCRNFLL